ncbi:sugar nucleotide-binding protein [Paucihalobacter ruber]|uniref:dTDP-4-dehydrorhamnose reductase n=1 Tax=Paucihalobacter ruber TaxID=2567861 RepID=A0A506PCI5_9FLAO|nr:sugar nucleotide-binding protein [Paucihalobacter ruber]TPV31536.1 sugar nucleotide-binding protein [Paucihalobacter ruber]
MKQDDKKHQILILGGSGFLGNAIYRELAPFFRTFATYQTPNKAFESNRHFFQYKMEEDDVIEIIEACKPSIIISALRGDFHLQTIIHEHIAQYVLNNNCKLIFISSANVFDAYSKFPSYELDKTLSNSIYGHFKIKIENMLLRLPKKKVAIIRLPMVFGVQCPRIKEMLDLIKNNEAIEVFPNLVMNVTLDTKVTQQIHYIINRDKCGIYHLGSADLVHHDDFIKELSAKLFLSQPTFKRVYTTNEERYLAVLPKYNLLPKHLQITSDKVIEELSK